MGGEGVPSPWTGPISVLRDIGGIAEGGQAASHTEASGGSGSSSDDDYLALSIRRQQASRRKATGSQSNAKGVVHPTVQRLESQFEAAGAPQQVSGTSVASRPEHLGQAAESSSSVAAVKGSKPHEQASQSISAADISQAQQAAAGNGAESSAEQQSFLFSNPTFESYLDSPSDDELAPVEGCTTPRSAIRQQISGSPWLARVQHFIQSPLSADSSPTQAMQSRAAKREPFLQASARLGALQGSTAGSPPLMRTGPAVAGSAAYPGTSPLPAWMDTSSLAAPRRPLPGTEPQNSQLSPARAVWGAHAGSAPVSLQGSPAGLNAAAAAARSSLPLTAQPQSAQHSAVPAQWRAHAGSAPASLLPSPVRHLGTAAAAVAEPQSGGPAVQSASATQSSQPLLHEGLQLQSLAQPENAESVAIREGVQHTSAGHRLAALPPPEQVQQRVAHPGGILSAAGGAAVLSPCENTVQGSLGLGFPGIGSTPAAHTIKGMCSLPATVQIEQTSANSRASEGAVCLSSPAVISLGSAGSPGIGSTPAADTIKALEAAASTAASQHDQGQQASPGLGSAGRPLPVGSTPAWNTIKALQRDHSSSKSVSILASGCSETTEVYAPSAPGSFASTANGEVRDSTAKPAHKQPKAESAKGRGLEHWLLIFCTLAAVIGPAALFTAGHIMGGSPGGRERLASGALGGGAASFGRCLQHMHAPESLQSALAGSPGHSYQPQHGRTAQSLMQEAACLVAAAAREGQRGLGAAAPPAARAAHSLHSSAATSAAHVERAVSTGLQAIEPLAHTCARKLGSGLWQLCPACKAPVLAALQACRHAIQQQRLWLDDSSALSSQLHPAEQLASWAPSKPSDMRHLMQASRTAAEAALRVVPSSVRTAAHAAWARASTWLGTCATWTPKEQPKLTPLHSAVFLAHDSANFALHGLKQAAGSACVMVEHAGTRWHMAVSSASATAAHLWDLLAAMLRFSSVAAMTDSERDAYMAAKSAHEGVAGNTLPKSTAPNRMRSWWGSLIGRNGKRSGAAADVNRDNNPSADVLLKDADASAEADLMSSPQRGAEHSSESASTLGLKHVQTADGGSVMWAGQPAQSGQPEEPEGSVTVREDSAGLQDLESAAGGMASWPKQPDELAQPTVTVSEAEDAGTLHHVQSERGGSITWQGQPTQQQSEQHEPAHTDAGTHSESPSDEITEAGSAALQTGLSAHSDTGKACDEERKQTAEDAAAASREAGERGDWDMEAEAPKRSQTCSATAPCEAQAQHADAEAGDLETLEPASDAPGVSGTAGEDASTQPSGRQDAQQPAGQVDEAAAAGDMESAASRGSPDCAVQGREGGEAPGKERGADGGDSDQDSSQTYAGGAGKEAAATLAEIVHSPQIQHAWPAGDGSMWLKGKNAEVLSRIRNIGAAITATLGLAAAAAYLGRALLWPKQPQALQTNLHGQGPALMAQAPPSGTKILVYRGTPLPRVQSVTFQEPLTGCGRSSEAKGERAASPKQAAQQPRARAKSSRFAAEPEGAASPVSTPRRSSLRKASQPAAAAPASAAKAPASQGRLRNQGTSAVEHVRTPRRSRRISGV